MKLVPAQPKIYHICHVDRLPSIVADGCLWCDAEIVRRAPKGTSIGMTRIKQRRLNELSARFHKSLYGYAARRSTTTRSGTLGRLSFVISA